MGRISHAFAEKKLMVKFRAGCKRVIGDTFFKLKAYACSLLILEVRECDNGVGDCSEWMGTVLNLPSAVCMCEGSVIVSLLFVMFI